MNQEDFYKKIPEWISKDKAAWNHITLMAYFCHKYEQKNKVRFRLVRWKADPGKGKESRDFAKLFNIFALETYSELSGEARSTEKQRVVKKIYNYINWMFDFKFRSGEKSVTGTGIFLLPSMINEFERMYSSFLQKGKSENLLEELLDWCSKNCPSVFDLHDLEDVGDFKMLAKYVQSSKSTMPEEIRVIDKAKELGIVI